MTLLDLCRLMRKYIAVIVVITLVGGAVGMGYSLLKRGATFEATAYVVGNSQAGGVLGFAASEGRTLINDPESETKISTKVETGTTNVSVTVTGPNEEECIRIANTVADRTLETALEYYADYESPYYGHVEHATLSQAKTGGGWKFAAVGLFGGFFLAVCIVVVLDLVKRPVISIESVQEAVELPVLEALPATNGERLLANVRFASEKDDIKSVCIVPLGQGSAAAEARALLEKASAEGAGVAAAGAQQLDVQICPPLAQDMKGAYAARNADAALVVAEQWADSIKALESTVAELRLAGAKLVGVVFANEKR